MDQETSEIFKQRLEAMARDLQEELGEKNEATAPVTLDTSIGRLSRMDAIQSQQMAVGLKARQQQQLMRVQNALDAIRRGAYGKCRRCGNMIAIDRLEVQPDALFCIQCAAGAR